VSQTGIITGPTLFSIDSKKQMYQVSIKCPLGITCMWLLDGQVIAATSSTSVTLIFKPEHIGNRTLSYVKFIATKPTILASLLVCILPSTRRGKV
jgi:hypothetical protein